MPPPSRRTSWRMSCSATSGGRSRAPLRSARARSKPRPAVRCFSTRSVRSEEHTSELQSRGHLVCRLLLEKKKQNHPDEKQHTYYNNQESLYLLDELGVLLSYS